MIVKNLAISLALSGLLVLGACAKPQAPATEQDAQPVQSEEVNADKYSHFALSNAETEHEAPCCRWRDDNTGCWYIIQSGNGGLTPEIKPNGLPLCDDISSSTSDPAS